MSIIFIEENDSRPQKRKRTALFTVKSKFSFYFRYKKITPDGFKGLSFFAKLTL